MKKFIYLLLLFPFLSQANAETDSINTLDNDSAKYAYRHLVAAPVPPDSADAARLERKAFWRASAETVGFNIGLWAFDRYVQKGHYAYINWNTIKANFKHGFEWDNDHLNTNMFAHPYNGSLYFNAGRSNGYNFWQSELFAIGGSAMWEMFMECEYPSTNDIIATPIGGAAIGEVLYRTSDLILDDRTTGGRRFGRELAAFLVSPMRGFTRIVTGRAWERRPTSGRRFGIPPISVEASLGTRLLVFHDADNLTKAGALARVSIEYGDRYASSSKVPYDYFSFLMELNAMKTQPLLSRMEIVGRLLSREVVDTKNCGLSVGMYQHFDFFDSDTISENPIDGVFQPCIVPYKFGTPASVGGGLMLDSKFTPQLRVDASLHANGIILGGILSDYYRSYHRNYNWGSGFAFKFGLNLFYKQRLSISLANRFYRLYTWKGYDRNNDWSQTPDGKPVNVQGDRANANFNHFEAHVNYRIWKRLQASIGIDWFKRHMFYEDGVYFDDLNWGASNPIITSSQVALNFMLSYSF